MRELSRIQTIIFAVGAVLMTAGVGLYVFSAALIDSPIDFRLVAPWMFLLGSIGFAGMQLTQTYHGTDITLRRLRTLMTIGDICFMLSALLMVENEYHWLFSLFPATLEGYNTYVQFVHNNWVVFLLVAVVFEMYTIHRISSVLSKEKEG